MKLMFVAACTAFSLSAFASGGGDSGSMAGDPNIHTIALSAEEVVPACGLSSKDLDDLQMGMFQDTQGCFAKAPKAKAFDQPVYNVVDSTGKSKSQGGLHLGKASNIQASVGDAVEISNFISGDNNRIRYLHIQFLIDGKTQKDAIVQAFSDIPGLNKDGFAVNYQTYKYDLTEQGWVFGDWHRN